jgi:hypothetical protein
MGFIDLISIIPFWIEFALVGIVGLVEDDHNEDSNTNILRVFRIVRVIRVFKLGALTKVDLGEDRNMVLHLFTTVISQAKPALQLVAVLVFLAMLVFGTLIWFAERGTLFRIGDDNCPLADLCSAGPIRVRQFPDGSFESAASPFESIPLSFWWVIVTITTVGYGDFFPVTSLGYAVGSVTILYGAMVFALPVGIIGTTFSRAYDQFLAEQTMRKSFEAKEESSGGGRLSLSSADASISSAEPPPLVEEMCLSLHQASVAAGLPAETALRWEASLRSAFTVSDDGMVLLQSHPCIVLEQWGEPVLSTLSELASTPTAVKMLAQARAAWYRLLLHTSQAYEEFLLDMDRNAFINAMYAPLHIGGAHPLSARGSPSSGSQAMRARNALVSPAPSPNAGCDEQKLSIHEPSLLTGDAADGSEGKLHVDSVSVKKLLRF